MPRFTPLARWIAHPALWIIASGAWYWMTRRAGWVTDILGLIPRLTEANGLAGAWTGYGSPVFHPLTLGLHYVLFRGFGAKSLAYYCTFVALHGLCAWLLATAIRRLVRDYGLPRPALAGTLAGALFLVHPYVVETVVWRATLNYLLCVPAMLCAGYGAYAYVRGSGWGALAAVALGTALGLLAFDLAWATPALVAVAAVLGGRDTQARTWRGRAAAGVAVSLTVLLAYLVVKRVVIGTAVGHYGAATHLNADPTVVLPNAWRMLLKLLLLTRELPFATKASLDAGLGQARWYLPLTLLALVGAAYWWRRLAPRSPRWRLCGWLAIGAVLSLAPTSNLSVMWLLRGDGDRYGYLPVVWLTALVAVAVAQLPTRLVRYAAAVALLGVSAYFNRQQLRLWAEGEYVQRRLLDDFPDGASGEVYVLTVADDYGGTYLFRDFTPPHQEVDAALRYLRARTARDTVVELVTFNQSTLTDSTAATVNADGQIELTFRQWGNWWWRGGIGLTSYETDDYRVTAGEPVRICFKRPLPDDALLLYQTGLTWTALPHARLQVCPSPAAASPPATAAPPAAASPPAE